MTHCNVPRNLRVGRHGERGLLRLRVKKVGLAETAVRIEWTFLIAILGNPLLQALACLLSQDLLEKPLVILHPGGLDRISHRERLVVDLIATSRLFCSSLSGSVGDSCQLFQVETVGCML